jgi:hypothetical protein
MWNVPITTAACQQMMQDSTLEIKSKIVKVKAAFNKKAAPFTSILDLNLRQKLLHLKHSFV